MFLTLEKRKSLDKYYDTWLWTENWWDENLLYHQCKENGIKVSFEDKDRDKKTNDDCWN